MKKIQLLLGIFVTVIGLLWLGQGLGYINWPADSFMIKQSNWSIYGAILAVLGLIIILFSRNKK